ncbi:hypothetical protein [Paracidovorax citrulli]|uniref:hypothetical protein n=1 Tax=Paracidovorax citrulli TaxID=80869 RepID=UPI0005FBF99D|nr:hypothetical protein [Paracidovorax citrulli]
MTGAQRGRIEVRLGTGWRLYQLVAPAGYEMLGTVRQGERAGALARSRTGQLVQLNAGSLMSLDQRKAEAAVLMAQG